MSFSRTSDVSIAVDNAAVIDAADTVERAFVAGEGRTHITVRSVWFLLLYASEYLEKLTDDEKSNILSGERDNDLLDALAEILATEVEARMRSMLARGYRSRTEPLTRVRGRIDHLGTARRRYMESGRILCRYEELTADLPRYRFMLVTLRRAGRAAVSKNAQNTCLATAQMLEHIGVSSVDPMPTELSREQYGYSDQQDPKLLALSRLVRAMCAPEHAPGSVELPKIVRDEHALRALFETAVRRFYQHHLSPRGLDVRASSSDWPAAGEPADVAFLPKLNADVVISGGGSQTIVECKFGPIFGSGNHGDKAIISPSYLRQLMSYAYAFRSTSAEIVNVVLLGALVQGSKGRDLDLVIDSFPVRIRQVDLSAPPSEIRSALLSAVAGAGPNSFVDV